MKYSSRFKRNSNSESDKGESSFVRGGLSGNSFGPYKPRYKFGYIGLSVKRDEYFTRLPFKRSWLAIGIMGVLLCAFSFPLFSVSGTVGMDGPIDDLFDLTSILFTLFWALGWSTAVLAIFLVFIALCFGEESLVVRSREVEIRMNCFGFGMSARYNAEYLSCLRDETLDKNSGERWRGRHMVIDYFDMPVRFGSHLDGERILHLQSAIQRGVGGGISKHTIALPGELPLEQVGNEQEYAVQAQLNPEVGVTRQPDSMVSKSSRFPLSVLMLVGANLVPIIGVLTLNWQVGEIMLLFWVESAVIGFFNVLKLIKIGKWRSVFMVPFFLGHYGGFMAGHLLFVFSLFLGDEQGNLTTVLSIFAVLWPAILSLFISHGFSFTRNFLGRKEYLQKSLSEQMHEPYKRIIVMHVTIIFGGFLVTLMEDPIIALLLLIGLKTVLDLRAHIKSHRKPEELTEGA